MKTFFSVSSRTKIDKFYLDDAKYISDGIAKLGYDLIIGVAMNEGMPGEVLKSFKDNNRKIYLKTLKVYGENPKEFDYVDFEYSTDTFERTKRIYDESDILIMMPGGTGSIAEAFAFLEQARTDSPTRDRGTMPLDSITGRHLPHERLQYPRHRNGIRVYRHYLSC